jgi:hypothetical protein
MTVQLMPVIEPDRISALPPSHAGHQVGFRRFQHQVRVVGHQAVRRHLPVGLLTGLGQSLDEIVPVNIVQVNAPAPVASAHHVIQRAAVLDAPLAGQGAVIGSRFTTVKGKAP